ncbi:MAG: ATP-binding protein [Candidatus Odinarchaeota archaeon]
MATDDIDNLNKFDISKDHLNLLNGISLKNQRILKRINNRKPFYIYSQVEEIIKSEIDPRFRNADQDLNDRGRILFFYGDFNTGKSYTLRYSGALCREKYNNYWLSFEDAHPIIFINLRDDINTAKQFLLFLLDKLGRPVDPRQIREWEKTNVAEVRLIDKVISILEYYKTRIIVLDECQRLLKARNPDIPNIFETIKDLTTKSNWKGNLRTHFILCGTRDGIPLLEAADWIQGRAHSIQLKALPEYEYGIFLWTIYEDFVQMGVSKDWDLAIFDEQSQDLMLNPEIALFLYERSGGKAGLTVELIRDAIKRALNSGRHYPTRDDYKLVIIEGTKYETQENVVPEKIIKNNRVEVVIGYDSRICKIKGCPRAKNPYSTFKSLINHYKSKHPLVSLKNREGDSI